MNDWDEGVRVGLQIGTIIGAIVGLAIAGVLGIAVSTTVYSAEATEETTPCQH